MKKFCESELGLCWQELTRKVARGQHRGEDRAFELPARVELLEAVDSLLAMDGRGDALALLWE